MPNIRNTLLRVLLIEDSVLTVDQIRELLAELTVATEITLAQTQDAALAAFDTSDFDVVLVDLQLKQGNGFRVIRGISSMRPRPEIIVLTNFALPNYRELAFLNGANHFLDKAKEMDRLTSILESLNCDRRSKLN